MSTHSYQPEMRRGVSRFAFSILGGLLLASQLVFPSTTFALSTWTATSADPPQSQALSEVSVVRLVFSYTATPSSKGTTAGNPVLCTSLGVLVNSIPASALTNSNSWVLTDGSLLNTTPSPCAPAGSSSRGKTTTAYALSSINVYANTVYTGNTSANALLGTYTAQPINGFVCFATPCTNGAFLFPFHTDQLQPILDIATANTIQQFGVVLTSETSPVARPPVPLSSTALAVAFLTPTAVTLDATHNQHEVGMPVLNTIGQMVAMNLQGNTMFTSADYNAIVAQRSIFALTPANQLQVAWENGITAYYSRHYQDAIKDFQAIESLNPAFKAAKTFELKATALSHSQSNPSGGGAVTPSGNATFFGIPRSTFLIIGIFAGLLLLSVLLIIISVRARRRHELARWETERAEAQRNVEREVQQMQQSKLQLPTEHNQSLDRQTDSTVNPQPPANTLCPNCGHTVRVGATYCPNCRYQLSPLVKGTLPTLNISSVPAVSIIDQGFAPSTTTEQPPVKEVVWDDLAIQATLKRLWDKAS